ncbi:hypothetical protein [Gimesia algae]|uniref:Glycosyltransferase RgtA/B/C/D-like domain-containing protein n=1 Tax=Gimesia algae TaxID=2527971 RepID=A0A517V9M3_9PLAN|nr:hypothetical protein [Gimesia algae]QDT89693.1 hypothetical protein Pan161_13250 [Gimesia algae]
MSVSEIESGIAEWEMGSREWYLSTGSIWLACLLLTGSVTIADPDLWGHTLYGLRALQQHVLVERTDPFCYTEPGTIWINHEWFSELTFGWLWSQMGNPGLWLWRNFWLCMILIPAWIALRKSRASLSGAVLLLVYGAFCLAQFVVFVRPQLVTFGCFAWTLLLLRDYVDRPQAKGVWYLPVVMLFWSNSHGGFLAGVGIEALVVLWVGWGFFQGLYQRRDFLRLAVAVAASWLVTLINPYGIQLHQMLWDHLITTQIVREWQPLWQARQALMYYIPFLLIALAFFRSRKWEWIDLMLIAVVAWQAVSHIRHVALLAIAVMILLPRPITDAVRSLFPIMNKQWSGPTRLGLRSVLIIVMTLAILGLGAHTVTHLQGEGVPPWQIGVETVSRAPGMPVAAMEVLKNERLTGNILTDYGWAQYVIWQTFPESRVAFDGRYRTVYSAQLEEEFMAFQKLNQNSSTSTPLLDQYPTEIILLPKSQQTNGYLKNRHDWSLIYEDEQATLWGKDVNRFQATIARSRRAAILKPEIPKWMLFPAAP